MAKILVADDEQDIVDLVRATLKLEGHTVITASTGRGAIAMARLETPDLALLDVSMPEGDGFVVAAAFTDPASGMPCPVIFLTARAERRYELLGYAHGAVDYISKAIRARRAYQTGQQCLAVRKEAVHIRAKSAADQQLGLQAG